MRGRLGRMGVRARLAFFAGSTIVLVAFLSGWLTLRGVQRIAYQIVENASVADVEELRGVLETQMSAVDRKIVGRLVSDVGHAPGVLWVGILDHRGGIKYSSHPDSIGGQFGDASREIADLQLLAVSGQARTEAIIREGCSAVRTVTALANGPSCQSCHGAERKVLGAIVIDRSLKQVQGAVTSMGFQVLGGGVTTLVVLLLVLGVSVERIVLKRLDRLRGAARLLGAGDLAVRAGDDGDDELGDLAREFDGMAGRLEKALLTIATERRQLEELVNGIADGVVLLDTDLRVVITNRACLGRLPAEGCQPGSTYRELAHEAGLFALEAESLPAERALLSGTLEKQVVTLSGPAGERVEEIYAQALRGYDGRPVAVIEVWRDITERKLLEASLEQSERLAAMGVLASSIAHEVGNPLASIVTAVDGLLRRLDAQGDAPREEMREYLEIVRSQVFRCRGVTERLLGFARVPSSELESVDAAAAAREVLALLAPQARAQRVSIEADLDAEVLAVAADRLLEQVFLNIALNALRVMGEGGVLTVSAALDQEGVSIRFADTGPGITEAIRQRLFQPFRRGRADGTGTGLGLFISQSLVARCGGRIEVASEPGKGAVFTVHLERPRVEHLPASDRSTG